nr:SWI/SNF-related matrix-associated actin-dependent regulator of chromatin subfamily A-like protein 1 [Leptinotarsa decemlineata]
MMANKNFYGKQQQTFTGKCVLINEDRFKVELSAFIQEAIDVFKTIPTRFYDPKSRIWNFDVKNHELVVARLNHLRPKLTIEPLPKFVLNCLQIRSNEADIDFDRLDPVLLNSLMPFQVEGLRFGINKNGRCLIADDMGLGKTFQALAIANYYIDEWPLLIITTSSMKAVWEETITTHLPSISIMGIQYMITGKDYIGDARILIVSHDMMWRSLKKLQERHFGVMIVDESHTMKSFKSKCFQSAETLAKRAKRVILLSGTPALSRPSELFTQLSLIDSKFFGTFYDFSKRYCDGQQTAFGWNASGKSNLEELEIILSKKFMIRRTKEEVMKALPNKKQEMITLDTNLSQFSVEDRSCLLGLAEKYREQKGPQKHSALLKFFSETAAIKIPSVCSYILQTLESKVKFLVFAHHQVMMDAIEDIVKKKDIKYIRIDGNTTSDQRKYFINKFQLDDKYKCAILSITAANAGITLTAAQMVLFAELHWNPSIISQAEGRAHRIGQENQVVVRYLIAPGTADDHIWPLLQEKQRTLKTAGLCKDSFDNVTVTKQDNEVVTDGLDASGNRIPDTRTYYMPTKKRKVESSDEIFDDGFDDILSKCSMEAEDAFNDGFDELLGEIDI